MKLSTKFSIGGLMSLQLLLANPLLADWNFFLGGEAGMHELEVDETGAKADGLIYGPKGTFEYSGKSMSYNFSIGYNINELEDEAKIKSDYNAIHVEFAPRWKSGQFQLGPIVDTYLSSDIEDAFIDKEGTAAYVGLSALYDFDLDNSLLRLGVKGMTDVSLSAFTSTLYMLELAIGFSLTDEGEPDQQVKEDKDVYAEPLEQPEPEPIPEVKVPENITATGDVVNLSLGQAFIRFPVNKDSLNSKATDFLSKLAQTLAENKDLYQTVVVNGHTDITGKYEYNKLLSDRRAGSVKKYLSENGIAPDRISSVGHGPDKLLDQGHSREAHAKNRRVDIELRGVNDVEKVKQMLTSLL